MADTAPKQKMLEISDFTGGLSPNFFTAKRGLVKYTPDNTFAFAARINPYVDLGVLTPAVNPAVLTNASVLSANIIKMTFDDANSKCYGLEGATKLHRIDTSGIVENGGTFPHTITASGIHSGHSGIAGRSLLIYTVNGLKRLFYAWGDTTDGDIGTYDFSSSFNDNALSGSSGGAALGLCPTIMWISPNGYMYIVDGNNIHKFDGTAVTGGSTGTMTPSVIDIPTNFVIKAAMDYTGLAYLGAIATTQPNGIVTNLGIIKECKVFVWDYTTPAGGNNSGFRTVYNVDNVTDLHAMRVYQGILYMWATSQDGTVQLRTLPRFGGNTFIPVQSYPSGSQPIEGSISTYQNLLCWLSANGDIYTYGSPYPQFNPASNHIQTGPNPSGAFFPITHSMYYASGAGTIESISFGSGAIQAGGASFYTKAYDLPKKSRIKGINVYWPPCTSSDNVSDTLFLYVNKGTSPVLTELINVATLGASGFKYIPFDKPDVNNVQIEFDFPSGITDVSNTIRPERFEVIYELTTKLI